MKTLHPVPKEFAGNFLPIPKRKINSSDDFGDSESVGVSVMKLNATINSPNNHFGIYLGKYKSKYCIGRYGNEGSYIELLECFDSLSEMKHSWKVD